MSDIFFLVLRRLRLPLIILISVYAIASFGMTLIPGITPSGDVWHMSFFHAFYFVSFMGTTIGFGEIPYAFSDGQRAWVLVCIYTSVIAWLYAIGNMLTLLQNETFQRAVAHRVFKRSIDRISLPFYIICGYGETGRIINRGLADFGMQTVIIDHNQSSTSSLELEDLSIPAIVLNADITEPKNLTYAGINHPNCQGVLAVTNHDHTNLKIAVASKLVNPRIPVICRSEIQDEANNMASFGTDAIINPYDTFAQRLSLLTRNPSLHRIQNWLINQHSIEHLNGYIAEQGLPKGRWIICGYGRLGKAIQSQLESGDIEITIIDPNPQQHDAPDNSIVGRGTEAKTLHEADILNASVVIAASDDDANNLSVLITAQQLNKDITTIARVSKEANHVLFEHAKCDYILRRSQIVANEALTVISRPLVTKFIKLSSTLKKQETGNLIEKIRTLTKNTDPITWRLIVNQENAPALVRFIDQDRSLTIGDISSNQRLARSRCIPLLLQRGTASHLLPESDMTLKVGDEILLCGRRNAPILAQQLAHNIELVDSLVNHNPHHIPLLRWLKRRQAL